MGIEWHLARFLVGAAQAGVMFRNTLTLGRQNLYVSAPELAGMFATYWERPPLEAELIQAVAEGQGYAEGFFRLLGVEKLSTVDASSYEGASIIHDMNRPMDATSPVGALRGHFDTVIDGGTLEHVFNFPTAIRNAMELVRVGGHLVIGTPANNHFGHGFYQFSPELFYRVLSPENGFEVERMVAYEAYHEGPWYEVADPASVRARVELTCSSHRVGLLVRARRTRVTEIFSRMPQQSDYLSAWDESAASNAGRPGKAVPVHSRTLRPLRRAVGSLYRRLFPMTARERCAQHSLIENQQKSFVAQPAVFHPVEK